MSDNKNRYKFNNTDYGLLSTAATIHENIVFFKGKEIKQISKGGDIVMVACISEEIPLTHGVAGLSTMIKIAKDSGLSECELEYEKDLTRLHDINYNASVDYRHSTINWIYTDQHLDYLDSFSYDTDILETKTNGKLKEWDIEISLTKGELDKIKRVATTLNLDSLYISPLEDGGVVVSLGDSQNDSVSNSYKQVLTPQESNSVINERAFGSKIKFDMDQIRSLYDGDYTISIAIGIKKATRAFSKYQCLGTDVYFFISATNLNG